MTWENLKEDIAEEFDSYQEEQRAEYDASLFGVGRSKAKPCACGNVRAPYAEHCPDCAAVHRADSLARYAQKKRSSAPPKMASEMPRAEQLPPMRTQLEMFACLL